MSEANKERLMSDIKTVLADAEDLLKQAASATGERASELRETALTRLKQAKEKAADVQVVVVEKGKKAARATDDYVHDRRRAHVRRPSDRADRRTSGGSASSGASPASPCASRESYDDRQPIAAR
jgi:ElaB/YqjD/DUF883 family membrane-anchored ribosome-binding protein